MRDFSSINIEILVFQLRILNINFADKVLIRNTFITLLEFLEIKPLKIYRARKKTNVFFL